MVLEEVVEQPSPTDQVRTLSLSLSHYGSRNITTNGGEQTFATVSKQCQQL